MALQIGKDIIGIAKQTAKGTIATNPHFAHGVADGSGIQVAPEQKAVELTSAYLNPSGPYRAGSENTAEVKTLSWEKSVGLYLLAALGSCSTAGSTNYTHTITLGSSLLYFTIFEKKGDDAIIAIKDCKLDELEFAWEANEPLEMTAKFVGGAHSYPSTFTPTVNEYDGSTFVTPVGGTFQYDVDSGTPATADVLGGKVVIKRAAEAKLYSGALEAGDVWEGACEVEAMLRVNPADTTLWRTIVTGTSSGAGIAATPTMGSFLVKFMNGTDYLQLAASSVAFLCDLPPAGPAGGAAESELSGLCYRAATATPITATVYNTQATY